MKRYAYVKPEGSLVRFYFTYGRPGTWILLVTLLFFIAQVWLVLSGKGGGTGTMDIPDELFWICLIAFGIGGFGLGILTAFGIWIFSRPKKSIDKLTETIKELSEELQKLPPRK